MAILRLAENRETTLNKFIILPILFAFGIVSVPSVAAQDSDAEVNASDEGNEPIENRFALLPHIFIDLEREVEYNWRHFRTGRIRRCDDPELKCLTGRSFEVVWPRQCEDYTVGDTWEHSGEAGGSQIKSSIVGSFSTNACHRSVDLVIVKTEGVKNYLYVLRPRTGLSAVIHDPAHRGILSEMISEEAFLAELSSGISETVDGFAVSYLVGRESIGECISPHS